MFNEKSDYIHDLIRASHYLEWNEEAHELSKYYGNKEINPQVLSVLIELCVVGSISDLTSQSQQAVRDLAKLHLVRPLTRKTNPWWHTWTTSYTELTDLGRQYVNMVFSIIHLPINTDVIPVHYRKRINHLINISNVWQATAVGLMISLGISFIILLSMVLLHIQGVFRLSIFIIIALLALLTIVAVIMGIKLWPSNYQKSITIAKAQIHKKSKRISLNDFINFLNQSNRWQQIDLDDFNIIIKHGNIWK